MKKNKKFFKRGISVSKSCDGKNPNVNYFMELKLIINFKFISVLLYGSAKHILDAFAHR